MPDYYIGIDIGGTNTRIAYSLSLDTPIIKDKTTFLTTSNFDSDFAKISDYINTLMPIKGIGISIPGKLNVEKTIVIDVTHNKSYINKPLVEMLAEKFKCRVKMDNDATAAALGEALYTTHETDNFLYIIWGTGVGGAKVEYINNNPVSTKLSRQEYLRYWEDSFGGLRLEEVNGKSPEEFSDKNWDEVMKKFIDVLLITAESLNTKKIIFGGGIAIKQSDRLREASTMLAQNYPGQFPKIEISKLGEDAGLFGALGLLR